MKSPWELEVEQILGDRTKRDADAGCRPLSPRDLVEAVSTVCEVTRADLSSRSLHREIVEARELLSYTAHEWCDASYPEISREIGRRSHSTVACAAKRFADRAEGDRSEALARVRSALPQNVDPTPRRRSEPARHGRGREA